MRWTLDFDSKVRRTCQMHDNRSRREFLRRMSVIVGGIAAVPLLQACQPSPAAAPAPTAAPAPPPTQTPPTTAPAAAKPTTAPAATAASAAKPAATQAAPGV